MENFFNKFVYRNDLTEIASINNGVYKNNLFGVSFEIPEGWHVVNLNNFNNLIKEQVMQGFYDDFKNNILQNIGTPACVFTKYEPDAIEYKGIVSPTINFGIDLNDDKESLTLTEYADKLGEDKDIMEYFIKKLRITKRGTLGKIYGKNSIIYETEYLFEHPELKESVMVEMNVLNIELDDFFLDFSMTQCKSQCQVADIEFQKFIKSIELY